MHVVDRAPETHKFHKQYDFIPDRADERFTWCDVPECEFFAAIGKEHEIEAHKVRDHPPVVMESLESVPVVAGPEILIPMTPETVPLITRACKVCGQQFTGVNTGYALKKVIAHRKVAHDVPDGLRTGTGT